MAHAPTIYRTPADVGISRAPGADKFGSLGEIEAVTFHHSAGPRAKSKAQAQSLHRAYQAQHIRQGYGDIGYHFSMDDLGRFYVLRPIGFKGAHVGHHNTGNVGIMLHGNYNIHRLTRRQRASLKWLFRGGLIVLTGESEHGYKLARGHQEWPGHNSNACPGTHLMRHLAWRRSVDFR
jgi:hypothetical protein